jgi:hypothetical protein
VNPDPDRALSRLYRSGAREEPPSWLDDRILAAARTDALPQAAPARPVRHGRWQVPLALAAVLTLAVSLTLVVEEEIDRAPAVASHDRQAVHTDASKPPAPGREAIEEALREQKSVAERAAQRRTQDEAQARSDRSHALSKPPAANEAAIAKADAEPDPRRLLPRAEADRAVGGLAHDRQATPSLPQSVEAAAPSVPPPAAAVMPERAARAAAEADAYRRAEVERRKSAQAEAETRIRAEAEARVRAEAEARPRAERAVPRAAQRAQDDAARLERSHTGADSPGQSDAPASSPARVEARPPMEQQRSPAAKAAGDVLDARSPEQWLRDIERLRHEGRDEEARTQLEAFRVRFPNHPLPQSLK